MLVLKPYLENANKMIDVCRPEKRKSVGLDEYIENCNGFRKSYEPGGIFDNGYSVSVAIVFPQKND